MCGNNIDLGNTVDMESVGVWECKLSIHRRLRSLLFNVNRFIIELDG